MRHRPIAVLAALLLALQALLHAFCMPAMGSGGLPICTPHGIQLVPADPGEEPARTLPDCPACQTGQCAAAYTPPARIAVPLPLAVPLNVGQPQHQAFVPVRFARSALARGPPAG
jgi:hypothetical protein